MCPHTFAPELIKLQETCVENLFYAACATTIQTLSTATAMSSHQEASVSIAAGSMVDDIYGNGSVPTTQERILKTAAMINASKQYSTKRIHNTDAGRLYLYQR